MTIGFSCRVWILNQVYIFFPSLKATPSSAALALERAQMGPVLRQEPGSKQQSFSSLGGAGASSEGSASPWDQACKSERIFKW